MLGRLLLAAGHQRIAYIAGIADSTTNRDREAGFKQALAAQGVDLFARADGGYNHTRAAEATRTLFSGPGPHPDAIFAANDAMALAVIDTLRHELGRRVPTDVSVVGYDDVRQAAWSAYQLTTVNQPTGAMVTAAVEIITARLAGDAEPARQLALPAVLMLRSSARLPADLSPFTTMTDRAN
jgi:DNA-binding LacI/PurR family transcriptional regulator